MSQAETTVIARHTFIKGDLKIDGPAVIAGRVEGSIIAEQVEIAPDGFVEGDIHAAVIDIHGTVQGKITATRACRLGATASVSSELEAANLSIAEGASFIGRVVVGGTSDESASEPAHEKADAIEEAAAVAAVSTTINRLEAFAAQVDDVIRTVNVAAPAPAPVSAPPAMTGPEIRVFPQTVQTMHRAPRIIKAR